MQRRGVMAPPVSYERPGLMAPAAHAAEIDHALAIRSLLWFVAGALAAVELMLRATASY
jgi:hypothetical protein